MCALYLCSVDYVHADSEMEFALGPATVCARYLLRACMCTEHTYTHTVPANDCWESEHASVRSHLMPTIAVASNQCDWHVCVHLVRHSVHM